MIKLTQPNQGDHDADQSSCTTNEENKCCRFDHSNEQTKCCNFDQKSQKVFNCCNLIQTDELNKCCNLDKTSEKCCNCDPGDREMNNCFTLAPPDEQTFGEKHENSFVELVSHLPYLHKNLDLTFYPLRAKQVGR